jgi:hypothetical protein
VLCFIFIKTLYVFCFVDPEYEVDSTLQGTSETPKKRKRHHVAQHTAIEEELTSAGSRLDAGVLNATTGREGGTRGRRRQSDYTGATKLLVNTAIETFKQLLWTRHPAPPTNLLHELAEKAWFMSCSTHKANIVLDPEVHKTVSLMFCMHDNPDIICMPVDS